VTHFQGTTDELFYLTIAVGKYSQWGKIRANLVTEAAPTPLQEKLEDTAKFVGYVFCLCLFPLFALISRHPLEAGNVELRAHARRLR
jgi:hypothetical protein